MGVILTIGFWLLDISLANSAPQQREYDRAFSQAEQLCEHYFLPNSMAREPGFDINAYLKDLDSQIDTLAKTFASSEGAAFLRAKARDVDDDVGKRCAEKLLDEFEATGARNQTSTAVDEMTCGRFRVSAFADLKARQFGVLLREYDFSDRTGHPKVLRSYVFPETQAEFDFRIAPESVYCELKETALAIFGRGYDESGDVVYRIRLDTSSWEYDFSSVQVSEDPK